MTILKPVCPQCGSDALYRYGHAPNGKKRYLCLICSRQFITDRSVQNNGGRPRCPFCDGTMHIYMRTGSMIRFRCARYPDCRGYQKHEGHDKAMKS